MLPSGGVTTIYACFILHDHCKLNNRAADPELVKIKTEKHKQDQLTWVNQEKNFLGTLMKAKLITNQLKGQSIYVMTKTMNKTLFP